MPLPPGHPSPLGASRDGRGVNFALYSAHATRVELLLFDSAQSNAPSSTRDLPGKTGPIWHGYVPDCAPGQLYAYRVHGPFTPEAGHRFNPNKVVIDPYARCIGREARWDSSLLGYDMVGADARSNGTPHADVANSFSHVDSAPFAPLGMVVDEAYDWKDDRSPHIPWDETIIYETHVQGLSRLHRDVPPELRGTFAGLASPPILDHLRSLGVTTVQLLPIHAKFSEKRLNDLGLTNYWGYNTLNYFSPEPSYASRSGSGVLTEFREMVAALHRAGLEVILDVVYNHTAESDVLGPTLSFRGIDNRSYYKDDGHRLIDYTGTGNTLDAGNSYVLHLIMDSLRYWVNEMHVDGFRFDLASALARDEVDVNMRSAFFQVIHQDPILSKIKLIAEPWDIGPDGYQVGAFPWQWTEWNGRYRDALRRFWRGDNEVMPETATRLAGSSDLYGRSGRKPFASINFITSHDGFTLDDLVSYTTRRNEANGEENRDGHEPSYSSNSGVEGPATDEEIGLRRLARKKSLIASLLLSQGVPMILGGDELSRTQRGNNNAYCQDNEISWYDWSRVGGGAVGSGVDAVTGARSAAERATGERETGERAMDEPATGERVTAAANAAEFLGFVREMIAFRKAHPAFRRHHFLRSGSGDGPPQVVWWNASGREMNNADWSDSGAKAFGMLLFGDVTTDRDGEGALLTDDSFLILLNAASNDVSFRLPEVFSCWCVAHTCDGLTKGMRFSGKESILVTSGTLTVLRGEK